MFRIGVTTGRWMRDRVKLRVTGSGAEGEMKLQLSGRRPSNIVTQLFGPGWPLPRGVTNTLRSAAEGIILVILTNQHQSLRPFETGPVDVQSQRIAGMNNWTREIMSRVCSQVCLKVVYRTGIRYLMAMGVDHLGRFKRPLSGHFVFVTALYKLLD